MILDSNANAVGGESSFTYRVQYKNISDVKPESLMLNRPNPTLFMSCHAE